MRYLFLATMLVFKIGITTAQKPQKPNGIEIYRDLQKLNVLGTVLYVAAHPDDENTRLISYFSNHSHAQTYYLSLTRGDGGQNLLGSDLKEALGLIRTQELLKARSIDGGQQRFTRAIDFGYSKSPEETLSIWNKDSVLNDMVWTIRNLKPDVIINRFDHRTSGTTHGHHTSSAMLSFEAFDMASNPNLFKSQLQSTETWQPQRLFFNTSWWFYGSRENFENADKSNLISFDIGEFYADLGLSNSEIAALSRSQHKSQAFGNTPRRGEQLEYLELIKGQLPRKNSVFEGIDTSWNRVKGGKPIQKLMDHILANFNFSKPHLSVPKLVEAFELIQNLEDEHWKSLKSQQIKTIIKACLGLYIESISDRPYANPNQSINIKSEIVNRSPINVKLIGIKTSSGKILSAKTVDLGNNKPVYNTFNFKISNPNTLPYWLNKPGKKGLYQVNDKTLIGLAKTPNPFVFEYVLEIENTEISIRSGLLYKYNDPVDGEVFEDFEVLPEVSIHPAQDVVIFRNAKPSILSVQVESFTNDFQGQLYLELPDTWSVQPKFHEVNLKQNSEVQSFDFVVTPPEKTERITVNARVKSKNTEYSKYAKTLDYKHIPKQIYTKPAQSNLVNINVKNKTHTIGYIKGAGDKVPENLKNMGFEVENINLKDIYSEEDLKRYETIVLGIRAYNTQDQLVTKNEILFDYVEQGGTLITQYTTTYGLLTDKISPLDMRLSRDRVTDEHAKVEFINPSHQVLNYPNKITAQDFEGWIQERGLYFPDQWSEDFMPIFKIQDYDDETTYGSLLIAKYGKGYYIYTGLSFFRQLPAGVPGAFRLMSNLLSLQNDE